MPTREHVVDLLAAGPSYATAARELHVAPGQVFMIATGRAADGSDVPPPDDLGALPDTHPQSLVNPRQFNPTRKEHVLSWVRERAARELERG